MAPVDAVSGFAFGGGSLVEYAVDGHILMLSTEILALNQPDADLRRLGDVQLGLRIAIALDETGVSPPFNGFAERQDGEISSFGPGRDDAARWELAFFLHDFRKGGKPEFVVLTFRPSGISVMPVFCGP